jgi:hypothetical protein
MNLNFCTQEGAIVMWFRRSKRSVGAVRSEQRTQRSPVLIESLESRRMLAGVEPADFNGDDVTDLLWRNYTTGQNAVWILGGTNNLDTQRNYSLPAAADTNWQIVGTGYFNADNVIDIVWHHATNGNNAVWFMAGPDANTVDHISLLPGTNPLNNWEAAGVNDFDNDGDPDILWRNATSGANSFWKMGGAEGTIRETVVTLPTAPDSSWVVGGTDDFDNDNVPDIFWRNIAPLDGRVAVWLMNTDGTRKPGAPTFLPTAPNVAWVLSYVHDFNEDGDSDLLWRNFNDGRNTAWIMNGAVVSQYDPLNQAPNTDWQITGAQVL